MSHDPATETLADHDCPSCGQPTETYPEFPDNACSPCVASATDPSGRKVEVFMRDTTLQLAAQYRDNSETAQTTIDTTAVVINGWWYRVNLRNRPGHHFGGVALTPLHVTAEVIPFVERYPTVVLPGYRSGTGVALVDVYGSRAVGITSDGHADWFHGFADESGSDGC